MLNDKRGQGLSTGAIILIILGVIVLVILAIGFFAGWDTIAPWISKSNNVDTLAQACQVACSTQGTYDFCTLERELKIEAPVGDFKSGEKYTCKQLSGESSFGVAACPSLC